jgi:uncharacterized membrane protein
MIRSTAPSPAFVEPALFEALIKPHRSLSARGLRVLIGAIICVSIGTSSVFWLLGAWPVAGFTGAEVALTIFLLRLNAGYARASELIQLRDGMMRILRTDPRGRQQERRLDPSWMRVVLRERPGRVPALLLKSRADEEEVAATLGEDEKRDLAAALRSAIEGWRHPPFDNVQLRSP